MTMAEATEILHEHGFVLNEKAMSPAQKSEFSKLRTALTSSIKKCLEKMDFIKKYNYIPFANHQTLDIVLKQDYDIKEVTEYVFQELNDAIYKTVSKTSFLKDAQFTPDKNYLKMVDFSLTKQYSNSKDTYWGNTTSIKISLRVKEVSDDGRTILFMSKGMKLPKYDSGDYFHDAG